MGKRETLLYLSIGLWLVVATAMLWSVALGHDLEPEVVLVVIGALSTTTVCLLVTMLADRLREQIADVPRRSAEWAAVRLDDTVPIPRIRATAAVVGGAEVVQIGQRILRRITDDN